MALTLTDRMSLVSAPEPTTGFTWSTRMALAGRPGVVLVDAVDVAGAAAPTLGGLTVAFTGTVVNLTIDGTLSPTLGPHTSIQHV